MREQEEGMGQLLDAARLEHRGGDGAGEGTLVMKAHVLGTEGDLRDGAACETLQATGVNVGKTTQTLLPLTISPTGARKG